MPEEAQNDIAAKMIALADEIKWAQLLSHPTMADLLEMLSAEGDAITYALVLARDARRVRKVAVASLTKRQTIEHLES